MKFNIYSVPPFTMPDAKTPGEKFRRSNPTDFKANTPRPFIPQFRFHGSKPSEYICDKPAGTSATTKGGGKFHIPPAIKPKEG